MVLDSIPVVILCGGRGIRFHEATEQKPKPLIEIGERPILWHIMNIYASYGFKDFILCLGYKGDLIKKYFCDFQLMNSDFSIRLGGNNAISIHNQHEEQDWNITFAETGLNAMTGARIKRIAPYVSTDSFMLTYGDAVTDVNILDILSFHKSHGRIGTVTAVRPISRFGELNIDTNGKVVEFKEKTVLKNDFINGGFFVFNRKVFDYVTDSDDCVLEKQPLEALAYDGELSAFVHQGYWQCMDTYRDWQTLDEEWRKGSPPWKIW